MSNNEDSNYVLAGSWMWMMFVTAIPVIGWIMILVWAIYRRERITQELLSGHPCVDAGFRGADSGSGSHWRFARQLAGDSEANS
jgi:hypothetical protein